MEDLLKEFKKKYADKENFKYKIKDSNYSLNLALHTCLSSIDKVHSIDEVLNQAYFSHIITRDSFIDILMEYLKPTTNKRIIKNHISSLTLWELKNILKDNDSTVSGKKRDLIRRIMNLPNLFDMDFGFYDINDKGNEFLKTHRYIEDYSKFMYLFFDFDDFERHFLETNNFLNYFETHKRQAMKNNDELMLLISSSMYCKYCEFDDENALENSFMEFVLRLSKWDKQDETFIKPLNNDNINYLRFVCENQSKNKILDMFEYCYSSVIHENLSISKELFRKTLIKIIGGYDIDYVSIYLVKTIESDGDGGIF